MLGGIFEELAMLEDNSNLVHSFSYRLFKLGLLERINLGSKLACLRFELVGIHDIFKQGSFVDHFFQSLYANINFPVSYKGKGIYWVFFLKLLKKAFYDSDSKSRDSLSNILKKVSPYAAQALMPLYHNMHTHFYDSPEMEAEFLFQIMQPFVHRFQPIFDTLSIMIQAKYPFGPLMKELYKSDLMKNVLVSFEDEYKDYLPLDFELCFIKKIEMLTTDSFNQSLNATTRPIIFSRPYITATYQTPNFSTIKAIAFRDYHTSSKSFFIAGWEELLNKHKASLNAKPSMSLFSKSAIQCIDKALAVLQIMPNYSPERFMRLNLPSFDSLIEEDASYQYPVTETLSPLAQEMQIILDANPFIELDTLALIKLLQNNTYASHASKRHKRWRL